MTHKQAAFAATAKSIIKNLEKRGMEAYFLEVRPPAWMPSYLPSQKTVPFHGAAAKLLKNPA